MMKISSFVGAPEPISQLGAAAAKYIEEGKSYPWVFNAWPAGFYDEAHASLQAYIAGQLSQEDCVKMIDDAYVKFAKAAA